MLNRSISLHRSSFGREQLEGKSAHMLTKLPKPPSKLNAHEDLVLRYLEPSEYPIWDALVDTSPQGSLFCRSWWLNAVGDVRVLGCFSGRELAAGIPLYFRRHFGIPVCTMPKLTRAWGVIMRPLKGKTVVSAARETKILQAFAVHLARYRFFFQTFHPNLSNWLPFYWSGFRQTTRFTYVLDDLADLGQIWHGISHGVRGDIRKAERAGLSIVPCSVEELYRCECLSYLRHGMKPSHSESFLRSINDCAEKNECGACFAVVDREGRVHSARLLVWDKIRAYNLVAGVDSRLRGSGANSFGVWSAIQFVAQRSRTFDFMGSIVEGIAHFNLHFGAKQVPYSYVTRAPFLAQCCLQYAGML